MLEPTFSATTTLTAPADCAGAVAVTCVVLTMFTFVATAVPNWTIAPVAKLAPVIVTTVPPAVGPDVGLMVVIVGAELGLRFVFALGLPDTTPEHPEENRIIATTTITKKIAATSRRHSHPARMGLMYEYPRQSF